jgi:flagellar biosynthesis regulator FlaF
MMNEAVTGPRDGDRGAHRPAKIGVGADVQVSPSPMSIISGRCAARPDATRMSGPRRRRSVRRVPLRTAHGGTRRPARGVTARLLQVAGRPGWPVTVRHSPADGVARVIELAQRGEGEVLVLDAAGRAEQDAARLEALFTAERAEEWAEFVADCGKFDAEIDKEIRVGKFTMAELEEEEQSLERLRRWYRDIKARDVFGAPAAAEAEQQLKHCADRLADYTEQVFQALHQM